MSAFHATMRWLLSCWDLSAEPVTAYRRNNCNEVNDGDDNIGEVNGDDENIGEVNSNEKNIVEVNGDYENIGKVNNENIGEVNEQRDNFVTNTRDDANIEAVNSNDENIKTASKGITLKMSERTHSDDGRKVTPHILKFRFSADFRYPSDNG